MSGAVTPDPASGDKPPLQEQKKSTPPPSPALAGATRGMPMPQSNFADQLAEDRAAADAAKPTMPTLTEPPKQHVDTNPFLAFGQPAMLIATLGSLFTRRPFVNAINAMGGVLKATDEKNTELAKHQYDEWKVHTENAVKLAQFQQKAYDSAMKKLDIDAKAGKAELEVNMLAYKDEVMRQAYDHGGIAEVKKLLSARKTQSAAAVAAQPKTADYLQGHITVAEGLGSDDPKKQAEAIDALRKQMRADAGGKGSTATVRQSTDMNDVRLDAAKQDILSGDPDRVARGQRLAENVLQLGAGALKTAAPGSSADLAAKVQASVLKQNPGMDPGQASLKAQGLIKQAKDGAGLKQEDAKWMADYALDTGDWTLISGWSRSAKDKEGVISALHQSAVERGMANEQINDMMLSHAADLSEVRAEGGRVGGRLGAIGVAANDAAKTIPIAQAAFDKLPRGEFRPYNQLKALVATGGNSPQQAAAASADASAIATYARALNPTGVGRESEIAKLTDLLSTNGDSPESHKATLDQWMIDIQAVLSATTESRDGVINGIRARHNLGPTAAPSPLSGGLGEKAGGVPPSLAGIANLQRSPSTGMFRDPATGQVYDASGNPAQ